MSTASHSFTAWAIFHPAHGFEPPAFDDGPVVYADLDAACARVRLLNEEAGTTNRNGWRAVKVALSRVTA